MKKKSLERFRVYFFLRTPILHRVDLCIFTVSFPPPLMVIISKRCCRRKNSRRQPLHPEIEKKTDWLFNFRLEISIFPSSKLCLSFHLTRYIYFTYYSTFQVVGPFSQVSDIFAHSNSIGVSFFDPFSYSHSLRINYAPICTYSTFCGEGDTRHLVIFRFQSEHLWNHFESGRKSRVLSSICMCVFTSVRHILAVYKKGCSAAGAKKVVTDIKINQGYTNGSITHQMCSSIVNLVWIWATQKRVSFISSFCSCRFCAVLSMQIFFSNFSRPGQSHYQTWARKSCSARVAPNEHLSLQLPMAKR